MGLAALGCHKGYKSGTCTYIKNVMTMRYMGPGT